MDSLKGWLPISIYQRTGEWWVDWCWFGEHALTRPFFRESVDEALRLPFNQAFRRETPLAVLCQWSLPALAPTAFIYHASRCGSTLISQMLAQLDDHIVVSEPPPLDTLLRAPLPADLRDAALRGLLAAYGQCRRGPERALVIKLDAWNIAQLPLLRDCFAETPWLFVYRDPLEIAVSHLRRPGMHMVPGLLGGNGPDDLPGDLSQEEGIARRLGQILQQGADFCRAYNGVPVNYNELPTAMSERLATFFDLNADQREQAFTAVGQHAKAPHQTFVADSQDKQRSASAELRRWLQSYCEPAYRELEALRLNHADDPVSAAIRQVPGGGCSPG
ncbi:sulfotransferase family protein [Pseudomonas sp. NPDC090202]|uniref:sulfotransferase family protein n=1 Tax=unclassified Pseudomonas TaxID=196821 RepID=UPI0037F7BF96